MDYLQYIDGCMDGASCPDAEDCRRLRPETCPLIDNTFEDLDRATPLDKLIRDV